MRITARSWRRSLDPLAFTIALARDAGALLLERLDRPRVIAEKSLHDLVTDADRASEALIVGRIAAAFPTAAILGEESGFHHGSGTERFIIDPLDGTTNYAHRYPLFCVAIAYERDGIVEAGAIYAPVLDRMYAARRGGGATLDGRPLHVSAVARLGDAMVCTGFNPAAYARNGAHFAAVSDVAQAVRRDGSAALDLCFVAEGVYDAFWEWNLKPWDVAAGALIVREAGGNADAILGGDLDIAEGSILAANPYVHAQLGTLLRATERARETTS